MNLYNNDCLEVMRDLSANSIDLLFCDLPYGQTDCKWDCKINLEIFWKEVNRICKINCPMFFTTTTRFGVDLINSNPKNFRYDLVWVKSASTGFLNAKKMPMRKHEMIYVFYRKLPLYDLSSHNGKFLKEVTGQIGDIYNSNSIIKEDGFEYKASVNDTMFSKNVKIKQYKGREKGEAVYDPPLPNSILEIKSEKNECYREGSHIYKTEPGLYDPPLPNSILEIKSQKGKHSTQKPTALMEWILKYYSKEGDTVLDPTMGSGSTGVACKAMKRNFIGIEMNETIYNGAVERLK